MQGDRDPSYDHRRMFDRHVEELMAKGKLRMAMNRDTINQKIQRLLQLEAGAGKVCQDDYRLSKLYSVVNFGDGVSVLVKKIEKGPEIDVHAMERFVPIEDYFDNLLSIHADGVGHGGRDRMLKRINEMKLANLPRELVQAFVSFCPQCAKKKPRPNAGIDRHKTNFVKGLGPKDAVRPHGFSIVRFWWFQVHPQPSRPHDQMPCSQASEEQESCHGSSRVSRHILADWPACHFAL